MRSSSWIQYLERERERERPERGIVTDSVFTERERRDLKEGGERETNEIQRERRHTERRIEIWHVGEGEFSRAYLTGTGVE
jgi:hypothetical protein